MKINWPLPSSASALGPHFSARRIQWVDRDTQAVLPTTPNENPNFGPLMAYLITKSGQLFRDETSNQWFFISPQEKVRLLKASDASEQPFGYCTQTLNALWQQACQQPIQPLACYINPLKTRRLRLAPCSKLWLLSYDTSS
ncbi:MAG: hypothetical protein U0003_05470 [Vampirovibrionales bacterium]